MKNKEKRIIFTIVGVIVLILLVVLIITQTGKEQNNTQVEENTEENVQNEEKYVTELSDGTKLNNSEELNSNKTYKTIEFNNIQFTSKDGNSVLLADIVNTGSSTFEAEIVKVTIIGENDEVIDEIYPVVPEMEPGETEQFNAIITADVVKAKNFTIEEAQ